MEVCQVMFLCSRFEVKVDQGVNSQYRGLCMGVVLGEFFLDQGVLDRFGIEVSLEL